MSQGTLGHCAWRCFQLALGRHAIRPTGCGWSWHRSPPLEGRSEPPLSHWWHRGQYFTHCLACHSCFTQIPTPSPLGCCSCWCSRPFHAQLCCFCVLCCSVLLHRRASGFAPASAVVTLGFAASQHPSPSSPICLTPLVPTFYKMGRKTVSSCLCSVLSQNLASQLLGAWGVKQFKESLVLSAHVPVFVGWHRQGNRAGY